MVGIPLLIYRLGKVLDSAGIPMGVVTVVKAGFVLHSLRYSEWCLSWEYFENFGRTFIGGVWASTSRGSGVGATPIYGAGMIVGGSVGGNVGTTLGSESGMVRGKRDLGDAVARRRI